MEDGAAWARSVWPGPLGQGRSRPLRQGWPQRCGTPCDWPDRIKYVPPPCRTSMGLSCGSVDVGSRPDRDVGRAQALAESRRGPFQWLWHWLGRAAPLRERGRVARGAAPATHGTPGRTPSRDGRAGAASHTHRGPTAVLDPARAIQSKGASPLTDVGPTRTAPSGLGSQALCRDNHAPQKSLRHGDVSVSTATLAPSTRGPRGSRTGGAKCRGRAQTEGRRCGSRVDSFRA